MESNENAQSFFYQYTECITQKIALLHFMALKVGFGIRCEIHHFMVEMGKELTIKKLSKEIKKNFVINCFITLEK